MALTIGKDARGTLNKESFLCSHCPWFDERVEIIRLF